MSIVGLAHLLVFGAGGLGQAPKAPFGEELRAGEPIPEAAFASRLEIAAREAKEAYRIADLRYREGESDLLDVLAVRQRVLAADTSLVSVERQLLDQRVSLHLALGGSWETE